MNVASKTHVDGTAPYPWPYDGEVAGAHLALVLAGWDDDWHGRIDPEQAQLVTERCHELAAAVARSGGVVLTVAHGHGRALSPPHPDAVAVAAAGLDGFWGGPLDDRLRVSGRTHLLIAGHGLEAPVHSLLRGANDRGYECLLVVDAASALDPSLRDAAASMVCMSGGIFGAVGDHAAVVDTLASLTSSAPTLSGAIP